ncbi:MAG: class I adenylate-forming enzyme family protein [Ilumatobacteraceae bacterium]|nr:class I adenylate-forming enzyme family protein [Ilumatobacteraceae bacterium]
MNDGDRARSTSWRRGPSDPQLEPWSIPFALRRAVDLAPDRIALVDGTPSGAGRRWTYQQLYDQSVELAVELAGSNQPGDRIVIWGANHPAWLITNLAAALAGLVTVPINPAYGLGEAIALVERTRPRFIAHAAEHRDHDLRASVDEIARIVPSVTATREFDEILGSNPTRADGGSVVDDTTLPVVDPNDVTQIQFTSGTTGTPKGVLLHHRGLVGMSATAVELMDLDRPPTWLNVIPLFHIGGCGVSTFGPITALGTQILAERFTVRGALDLIESEQVTVMGSVPTMLVDLLRDPGRRERNLESLEVVMSGGAPVSPRLVREIERELDVRFVVAFGQTECHGHITQTRPDDSAILKAETVGRPLPHVEVKVVDADSGRVVDIGEPGEVWTRSPFVMHGYHDDPTTTADALTNDGYLRTGDLCTMDPDGYLRVVGRLKDQICRGGENISPGEIEAVVDAHPAVAQTAVIGLPDERWGEIVAAFVLPHGEHPSTDALTAWTGEHLADYKVPSRWFVVDELPMTPSGKIRKHVLRDTASTVDNRTAGSDEREARS